MTNIIVYCAFCYLVELGIHIGSRNNAYGSIIFAPIMFPIEFGIILGKNFIK